MPLSNGVQLIGIAGAAGSGKDTAARIIQALYKNTYIEHFADSLKDACSVAFDIPREYFDDRTMKSLDSPFWGVSPRKIAQFVGTEMFRELSGQLIPMLGDNFWVRRLEKRLTDTSLENYYASGDTVIIPDVRFPNECDWIRANGGALLYIHRDTEGVDTGIKDHKSESHMYYLQANATHIFNNGTLGELANEVDRAINSHNLSLSPY